MARVKKVSRPQPTSRSSESNHLLHGETVVLDYCEYMPKGARSKDRWKAYAKAPDGMTCTFWMYKEHAQMLKDAGFQPLHKRVCEQHYPPSCLVVLTHSAKLGLRPEAIMNEYAPAGTG